MTDVSQLVKNFVDAHNRHALDEMLAYIAEDVVMIDPAAPIPLHSKADVRRLYQMIFTALPDIHFEITHLVAAGNEAFTGFRTTATGHGSWAGRDITGRRCDVREGMFLRIDNDQIQFFEGYSDSATISKQLGGYETAASRRS